MGHRIVVCQRCKNPMDAHHPRCPERPAGQGEDCPECGRNPCQPRCPLQTNPQPVYQRVRR